MPETSEQERVVRKRITAEYRFTDAEKLELANELASKTMEKERLDESKKNYNSQLKSEIDTVVTDISLLSLKITTGSEHREFYCKVFFDYELGVKRFYDDQTGELRKTEPLSAHEWQMRMGFEDDDDADNSDDERQDGQPDGHADSSQPIEDESRLLPEAVEDGEFTPVEESE